MESVVVKKQPMDKLSPIEFPPRSNADGCRRLSSNFRFLRPISCSCSCGIRFELAAFRPSRNNSPRRLLRGRGGRSGRAARPDTPRRGGTIFYQTAAVMQ